MNTGPVLRPYCRPLDLQTKEPSLRAHQEHLSHSFVLSNVQLITPQRIKLASQIAMRGEMICNSTVGITLKKMNQLFEFIPLDRI
jgi:hypothetical protein